MRREFRLVLLAAMETCWTHTILTILLGVAGSRVTLSPLPLFAAYWLALIVGRVLPQTKMRWLALQFVAFGIALATVLLVVFAELYSARAVSDLGWLAHYVSALLTWTNNRGAEQIISAGAVYVFLRGLGFAQRPLTLWFVGYQFRLGVVAFLLALLFAGLTKPFAPDSVFDPSPIIFFYFFISLCAIALARIEEMGGAIRYSPRWGATIAGSIAIVLILGLVALQFLNPETVKWLFLPLLPVWWVLAAILLALAFVGGFFAGWLVDLLRPLFESIARLTQIFPQQMPPEWQDQLDKAQADANLGLFVNFGKTLLVAAALLLVGYLLARALNRRMKQIETEEYAREAIGMDETDGHTRRATSHKKKSRSLAQRLAAENIRRIYAALVARAARAGLPRRPAETPYEFLPRLQTQWQTDTDDLRAITEAYVAAHYGELDAPVEQVNRVRAAWARIKIKTQNVKVVGK